MPNLWFLVNLKIRSISNVLLRVQIIPLNSTRIGSWRNIIVSFRYFSPFCCFRNKWHSWSSTISVTISNKGSLTRITWIFHINVLDGLSSEVTSVFTIGVVVIAFVRKNTRWAKLIMSFMKSLSKRWLVREILLLKPSVSSSSSSSSASSSSSSSWISHALNETKKVLKYNLSYRFFRIL